MRVLDLFAGLGGASSAWKKAGHEVVTVDWMEDFDPTVLADVLDLTVENLADLGPFDFIWASPPCQRFSVMTITQNWDPDGRPRLGATQVALALIRHTLYLAVALQPRAWLLENPVGMLRVQPFMRRYERKTVTYCQYGMPYRKATDLWGGFPPTLHLRPPCRPGASCHEPGPRSVAGGKTGRKKGHDPVRDIGTSAPYINAARTKDGMQAISLEWIREVWDDLGGDWQSRRGGTDRAALRALVPYELSQTILDAMEKWPSGRWTDSQITSWID